MTQGNGWSMILLLRIHYKWSQVYKSTIYLEMYFYCKIKYTFPTLPTVQGSFFPPSLLEIQFGHCLQESLLPFLCSQLQNFLWVTGVQLRLSDRFYLRETWRLKDYKLEITLWLKIGSFHLCFRFLGFSNLIKVLINKPNIHCCTSATYRNLSFFCLAPFMVNIWYNTVKEEQVNTVGNKSMRYSIKDSWRLKKWNIPVILKKVTARIRVRYSRMVTSQM